MVASDPVTRFWLQIVRVALTLHRAVPILTREPLLPPLAAAVLASCLLASLALGLTSGLLRRRCDVLNT